MSVIARLYISVFVDCPNCEHMIDLMNPQDTSGYDHNDCGEVLKQACPSDGHWSEEHEEFRVDDVKCTACGHEFDVKEMDW